MKKQRIQRESDEMKKQRQRVDDPQKRRRYAASNRTPWGLIVGALLIILAVVGVIVYLSQQSGGSTGNVKPTPASANVLDAVTHVSPSVLSAVGTGGQQKLLTSIRSGSPPPLIGPTGKPEIFYYGAEYCPYCAAERWAVVVALSQFGTFSKLNQTTSSSTDVYPSTPTFTFYQSAYTSQYIDFVSVESTTNQSDGNGGYTTLQTPTADQTQLLTKYDGPPYLPSASAGSIPFIDVANQMVMAGANYSPQVLSNLSWDEIANDLSNPSSTVTKGIVGSANYLTAAICMTANQKPTSVCTAAPIPTIEQSLGTASVTPSNQQLAVVSPITEAVLRRPE
jgi:thiol-disulfide isomerase/thioredoxin